MELLAPIHDQAFVSHFLNTHYEVLLRYLRRTCKGRESNSILLGFYLR